MQMLCLQILSGFRVLYFQFYLKFLKATLSSTRSSDFGLTRSYVIKQVNVCSMNSNASSFLDDAHFHLTSGLTVTIITTSIFIKYNHTPVVKSSSRELSYTILVGISLCFMSTFTLIQKPSHVTCVFSR